MTDPLSLLSAASAIRGAALAGVRDHYSALDLPEVHVPVLVGITGACENVSTLFKVADSPRVHLTQTGQLALEHALRFTSGVCCVTPSFRTDEIDERHLNEFTLVEEEFSHTHPSVDMAVYDPAAMFEHLLDHITLAVRAIGARVVDTCGADVRRLGGDPDRVAGLLAEPFVRITYTDAVELLQGSGVTVRWGDDLGAAQEAKVVELVAAANGLPEGPTFITHYPSEIKFFNMRVDDADPRCVQSADLVLPNAGEAVGSAVREHNHDALLARLTGSTMYRHLVERGMATLADFEAYLTTIKEGRTAPHAGYGIGLERVIQFIIGSPDIRDASVAFQLNRLTGFADTLAAAQPGSRSAGF